MKNYVGIDLGTTNSVICYFDGEKTHIAKSREQNDVTPSVIYVDKKGRRFYGINAYNQLPSNPGNIAYLFKRFMGTDRLIDLPGANISLTPVECSSEILKLLFNYLPEEIRNSDETGTVITVPAAFNQAKKEATKKAAEMAGLGKVTLMQEPVAAIMSIMKNKTEDGIFVIYDLGGGTFDVSIAENIGGKVNLLTQGGIEMCGGRDIDRSIVSEIVIPWLNENFDLPDDIKNDDEYHQLYMKALWASERAKIELSSHNESRISQYETEINIEDLNGDEIYLDIPLTRDDIDDIISDIVQTTVEETRKALTKVGLGVNDVEKIVFVGGPTNYKPLRDKVSSELHIPTTTEVNPMTAVAEGASIFAETIDWDSISTNGTMKSKASIASLSGKDISFKYTARVSNDTAKIITVLSTNISGYMIEIVSRDVGTTTGRIPLENKKAITLSLSKRGDNTFEIYVYDPFGKSLPLPTNKIVITKIITSSISIPASHSIGLEALDKMGGSSTLKYLVNEGDDLPKTGSIDLIASEEIEAGDESAVLHFKIWEGDILSPISDNRKVGDLTFSGSDFDSGIIRVGDKITLDYDIDNAETIKIEVSVPSIGATFDATYSGKVVTPDSDSIASEMEDIQSRRENLPSEVYDERLDKIDNVVETVSEIEAEEKDPEVLMKAENDLLEAKKELAVVRMKHLPEIRRHELEELNNTLEKVESMDNVPDEDINTLHRLIKACENALSRNDNEFESLQEEFKSNVWRILFQTQDWFIIKLFESLVEDERRFGGNMTVFNKLKEKGEEFIENGDIEQLRKVVSMIFDLKPGMNVRNILPTLG